MPLIFRPPPGWPPPPPGWQPPLGWQPDPSWPPAPLGWQFWGPRPKRRLWLAIGLPVGLGVVLLASLITVLVYGVSHTNNRAKSAAASYVRALQDKRYAAANGMLCTQDQQGQQGFQQSWASSVERGHGVAGFKITDVAVHTVNGRSAAEAAFSIRYADGS
ncbi:MAG: hypothetical protein JWO63_1514, partial [Frankiales bacterium]|nr:hypothetical protein [Frankiales bacterium]